MVGIGSKLCLFHTLESLGSRNLNKYAKIKSTEVHRWEP